jgi:hypothetical protein
MSFTATTTSRALGVASLVACLASDRIGRFVRRAGTQMCSLRGTRSKGMSIVALVAAAMAAFVASPNANAAPEPTHTRPTLVNTVRSAYYPGTCTFYLSNPRVWAVTRDPANEFVAWLPVANPEGTREYLWGSVQAGFASYTNWNPPLWYFSSLQGMVPTKSGTVEVPKGPQGYPRYYWIGFEIQSQGVWLWPSDGWLTRVSC